MYIYLNGRINALEFMDGGQHQRDMKGMFFAPVLAPVMPHVPIPINIEASLTDIPEGPL